MSANEDMSECDNCERELPLTSLSACPNCHEAQYCSSSCKEAAWKHHRLRCLPPNELTSADRLAKAVYRDLLPTDADVRRDYGFDRTQVPLSENFLLGMFKGLIMYRDIDPRAIHEQRLAGTLIENIKIVYEAIPVHARGGYYPWFLKNQHLLAALVHQDTSSDVLDDDSSLEQTWRFTGGSAQDSPAQIKSRMGSWPENKQECFRLIRFLLHPNFQLSPDRPEWVDFGFCGCNSRAEETELWSAYIKLINAASFGQFFDAYDKSSLPVLFATHNLPITSPLVLDVLSRSPMVFKSVWNLKQFVAGDYQRLIPSITVDYGFVNCGENEEIIYSLKQVYHRVLLEANADPLELHKACLQGRLFQFATQVTKLDAKFAHLMRNIYPIGDEGSEEPLGRDPKDWKSQDHYAVLELSHLRYKATPDQIEIAHQQQTLKHNSSDDAFFNSVAKAYEVLSHPERRKQFDSVDPYYEDLENDVPTASDLARRPPTAFLTEFGPIFEREARFSKKKPVPLLGAIDAPKSEVEGFYNFWYNFDSWRSFEYLDKHGNEGDNRNERRYREKKNRSERARRKKEDNTRIHALVDAALALDPRIKRIKQEEKAAREAKKRARARGGQLADPAAEEKEEAGEDEAEEKEEAEEDENCNAEEAKAQEEAKKAEAKKAKAAAANAAKKARRAARQAEGGA